jgi:hypothetical protein
MAEKEIEKRKKREEKRDCKILGLLHGWVYAPLVFNLAL